MRAAAQGSGFRVRDGDSAPRVWCTLPVAPPGSVSLGFTDFPQVDKLGVRYSTNLEKERARVSKFGASEGLGSAIERTRHI